MSTGPVSSTTTSTATSLIKRANAKPFLGIAAMIAAAMMVKDTFRGNSYETQRKIDEAKEHAEWEYMMFGKGHYSGHPGMDHLAHKFHGLMLFGPFRLRVRWIEFKTHVENIVNTAIKNAVPIALGVGGLYATFGRKAIHGAVGRFFRFVGGLMPKNWHKPIVSLLGSAAGGIGKGIRWAFKTAFKSPGNLAMTLGALVFGGFALGRFKDSYGHDGQHDYFRDQIFGGGGH